MRRLLRRSVLVIAVSLISALGIADGTPSPNEQPDAAVVPLLDPAAMPESAIPVARAATTSRSAPSLRFPYVPEPEYITSPTNYWAGRDGASIDYIVIHYTDISYARTLRAFNNMASDVSAHYVIRGDGHIAQIVAEGDTAWHSGNAWYNRHSIGIEFELDRVAQGHRSGSAPRNSRQLARPGVPRRRLAGAGTPSRPGGGHRSTRRDCDLLLPSEGSGARNLCRSSAWGRRWWSVDGRYGDVHGRNGPLGARRRS